MRSSWEIQQSVIKALLGRELKTRFGKYKLGYALIVFDPLAQILVLVVLFSLMGRGSWQGIEFALFVAASYMPYRLFLNIFSAGSNAAESNKGLFTYRQVKPLDAFITRALLESTMSIVGYCILLCIFLWWGFDISIDDPLLIAVCFICLSIFGFGFSLILGVVTLYFKDISKMLVLIQRPLYFGSGIFFPSIIIPQPYRDWLLWNPIMNAIELIRIGWYPHYQAPGASLSYLAFASLVTLFIGLIAYRSHWTEMVAS